MVKCILVVSILGALCDGILNIIFVNVYASTSTSFLSSIWQIFNVISFTFTLSGSSFVLVMFIALEYLFRFGYLAKSSLTRVLWLPLSNNRKVLIISSSFFITFTGTICKKTLSLTLFVL